MVVEPQEAEGYASVWPTAELIVLPDRDRGISFSRQWILDEARHRGLARYWQIDDNVKGFARVNGMSCQPCRPEEALRFAEELSDKSPRIALVGFEYQQFGWSAKRAWRWNARAYCCVLTRTDTGKDYDPATEMKEDVDFCLQHVAAGWATALVSQYVMSKPKIGDSGAGGLAEKYAERKDEQAAKALCAKWPGVVKLRRRDDGRLDASVDWAAFARPTGGVDGA